jgi:hypothetical protein
MVVGDMTGASSEFKILKAVVVLDFVDVVDVFIGSESAAKMALHDDTMLKHVDSTARELYVAIFADSSGDVSVAALTRAEAHCGSPFSSAWLDRESVSARFADESDSHSSPAMAW